MKLSKEQLKRIIKEELEATLLEKPDGENSFRVELATEMAAITKELMDNELNRIYYYLTSSWTGTKYNALTSILKNPDNFSTENEFRYLMKAILELQEKVNGMEDSMGLKEKVLNVLNSIKAAGKSYI